LKKPPVKKVPYVIALRIAGDIAKCYANPTYVKQVLGWEAKKNIEEMCADSWKWQPNNPAGYEE